MRKARSRSRAKLSDRDRKTAPTALKAISDSSDAAFAMHQQHGDILSVLDKLRATRKARGGVGAPLVVPAHLRDAAEGKPGIIITDVDLSKDAHKGRTQG